MIRISMDPADDGPYSIGTDKVLTLFCQSALSRTRNYSVDIITLVYKFNIYVVHIRIYVLFIYSIPKVTSTILIYEYTVQYTV